MLADTPARTAVRSPSIDKAAADALSAALQAPLGARFALDVHSTVHENDMGPREPVSPRDQVSERSANFAPRRFVQPLLTTFQLSLLYAIPRSSPRALALPMTRFWTIAKARVTKTRHTITKRCISGPFIRYKPPRSCFSATAVFSVRQFSGSRLDSGEVWGF